MAEEKKRTGRSMLVLVLAVPVVLTIAGAVLVFVLPFHGYEPGEALTTHVQTADCRARNPALSLRLFQLERPVSMNARTCLEAPDALDYVTFEARDPDGGLRARIAVLPGPEQVDEQALDDLLARDAARRHAGSEPTVLTRAPYPARGTRLLRRDLTLHLNQPSPELGAGDWVMHVVVVPRPHGGGSVVLHGEAKVQGDAQSTLLALNRRMAPMIESLRF